MEQPSDWNAQPAARPPWRALPFVADPDDPELTFPAAEGYQGGATDTSYASGFLRGERTGRRYAFAVIFVMIRRAARIFAADFHIAALYDLDAGSYTTLASYDMPPGRWLTRRRLAVARGRLDAAWHSRRITSRLAARATEGGEPAPFAYTVSVTARDGRGAPIALELCADAVKPPQLVGGPAHRGVITMMGQPATHSYYQPLAFSGHLRWRDADEPVRGAVGWLDRQWFPEYVGAYAGPLADRYGHHWAQLSLDNGWELSLWRHFARTERNRVVPFSGVTITDPRGGTSFAAEHAVEPLSYCRDPGHVEPLMAPLYRALGLRPAGRYLLDAFRLHVPALDLHLTSTPLVPAPAHRMPVDYFTGPTQLAGTMGGVTVGGLGFSERTLALWRPWELHAALGDLLRQLPPAPAADRAVAEIGALIEGGRLAAAHDVAEAQLRPALDASPEPQRAALLQLAEDLALALRRGR